MSERDPLLNQRIVRLSGPIDDATANDVIARFLYLEMASKDQPIHLIIDSPGGLVLAGLAILDTIDRIKPRVHTHCAQIAGGMALVILTCGHRGARSAYENSQLIFNLPEAPKSAPADVRAQAERLSAVCVEKTAQATGISEADVLRLFHQQPPITGSRAQQLGLIDRLEQSQ